MKNNPYQSLKQDLYALGIFDPRINGLLSIVAADDETSTLILERRFLDANGEQIGTGFYLVRWIEGTCSINDLVEFRKQLEIVVKERGNTNYMEVTPLLIANAFDADVIKFTDQYRNLERRAPIELITY